MTILTYLGQNAAFWFRVELGVLTYPSQWSNGRLLISFDFFGQGPFDDLRGITEAGFILDVPAF